MRSKSLVFVVGGLAVAAVAAALAYWFVVASPRLAPPVSLASSPTTPAPAPAPAASSPAAAPKAEPSAAKPPEAAAPSPASTPAFDVVRIEPTGDAVVAGRAAPGAQVELGDDGKTIGAAAANDAGQFVILPSPLSPGRHPLRLSAKVGDGAPQFSDVVVVEVAGPPVAAAAPKPSPVAAKPASPPSVAAKPASPPSVAVAAAAPTPQPPPTPVASAAPPASPPTVAAVATPVPAAALPASPPTPVASAAPPASPPTVAAVATPVPAAAPPAPAPAAAPTASVAVAVGDVRPVDPAGLEAVGSAPPGARIRLRLNNSALAEVTAGADGVWRLTIERGLTAGDYILEAVAVDAAGAILARAEAPFVYPQREIVASAAPASPAPASPAPASPAPASSGSSSPATPAAVEPPPAASPAAAAAAPSSPPSPSPAASAAAAAPTPTETPAATPSVAAAPAPTPSAVAPAATPAAAESPVATAAHAVVAEVRTVTVVHGDNLWDLAIKYYGDGLRYADIFSANASKIRNPNLIYIGQIFVVPQPTATPPAAR